MNRIDKLNEAYNMIISEWNFSKDKTKVVEKSMLVPFIMLVSCFVLWGLLNNMTDNLVPAFGKIFMMSAVDSSFVQIAFYGAYAVLAIPAAIIIKKFSYRVERHFSQQSSPSNHDSM